MKKDSKGPSFGISILIIAFLFVFLFGQVIIVGEPDIHLTLVFAITFASILLMRTGTDWSLIQEGILHGAEIATIPMLILMLIGMLISHYSIWDYSCTYLLWIANNQPFNVSVNDSFNLLHRINIREVVILLEEHLV